MYLKIIYKTLYILIIAAKMPAKQGHLVSPATIETMNISSAQDNSQKTVTGGLLFFDSNVSFVYFCDFNMDLLFTT